MKKISFLFFIVLICLSIGCKSEPSSSAQGGPNPPTAIYLVIFDANGGFGTMPAQNFIKDETKALSANIFTMPDKVFTGWNTSADGTGTSYTDAQNYTATGNITLYAQWTDIAFVVTFDKNDGSGETVIQPFALWTSQPLRANTFTITDKVFTGWNTSADGTGISYADGQFHIATENITLYAQWADIAFVVTFDKNDGSGERVTQPFALGISQALKANTFTITNKVFTGWNTSADGMGLWYADGQFHIATENITLYAQWADIAFVVTFDKNDGSGEKVTQTFAPWSSQALRANTFTITDKVFDGWTEDADGTGFRYGDGGDYTATENITLYAQWRNIYTVTFDKNDDSGTTATQTFTEGQAQNLTTRENLNLFDIPELRFASWNTSADGTGTTYTDGQSYTAIANITLYAQWNFAYLCFTAEEPNSTVELSTTGTFTISLPTLEYSTDGLSWEPFVVDTTTVTLSSVGDKFYLRGDNDTFSGYNNYLYFSMTGKIAASGNIMSLLDNTFELKSLEGKSYCFYELFRYCYALTKAPELPATTLAEGCYEGMFQDCGSLQEAPELPATTLEKDCYRSMFSNCYSLKEAPELPATTLAVGCYSSMFSGCTWLRKAPPELPATTLAAGCYEFMFCYCSDSLQEAPELPATTLASNCYAYMFYNCHSLKEAPELPATTLALSCYENMFYCCYSLQEAPELPATTLARKCYKFMFYRCYSLQEAPELPATTLAESCYEGMFCDCNSLREAPELPATTLEKDCYRSMFSGCDSLKEAPELPAGRLVGGCYHTMFSHCYELCYIKVGFFDWCDWLDNSATGGWLTSAGGGSCTFVCPSTLRIDIRSNDTVPDSDRWTIERY